MKTSQKLNLFKEVLRIRLVEERIAKKYSSMKPLIQTQGSGFISMNHGRSLMRTKAIVMSVIMILVPVAGCTGDQDEISLNEQIVELEGELSNLTTLKYSLNSLVYEFTFSVLIQFRKLGKIKPEKILIIPTTIISSTIVKP